MLEEVNIHRYASDVDLGAAFHENRGGSRVLVIFMLHGSPNGASMTLMKMGALVATLTAMFV
jgi:hypothetical protein